MKSSQPLEMSEELLRWNEYFYYCATSPSGLRWKVNNTGWNNQIYNKADSPVGFITNKGYWRICFKGKAYLVHRIVCEINGFPVDGWTVDHIDRNSLNNSIENLRLVPQAVNCRNKGVPKNNTSGVVGVGWQVNNGRKYAIAGWVDPKKACPKRIKRFSVSKYGEIMAFKLACDYRLEKLKELDIEYSINHGFNIGENNEAG